MSRKILRFLTVSSIFLVGMLSGVALSGLDLNSITGNSITETAGELINSFQNGPISKEIASPSDWIKENQIEVYSDRIIIDLKDAEWASFTNTNSMDPVIDEHANAIQIIPKSEADINVGDIISYESEYAEGTIIHRVIYKGKDELGTYFVMKGDNNPASDPGKVRFSQIRRVTVAIIY